MGNAGRWWPRGAFARRVGVLAGGTVLSQALVVAASPLLTRLYAPEDFGAYAAYVAVLSLVLVVSSWLYDAAIPLPEQDVDAANLLGLSLLLVGVTSALSVVGVWLFGDEVARLMKEPEAAGFLWLLPVSLLGAGAYQALNGWALRKKSFGAVARTKFTQSVGLTFGQIGFGIAKVGPWGLLLGDLIGRFAGCAPLAREAWKADARPLQRVTWAGMKEMAVRYRRFPLLSGGSSLLNAVVLQLPALLLTTLYSMHVVGWFVLAQRVLGLPLQVIGQSVAQVYTAEAADIANRPPDQMRDAMHRLFWKTAGRMLGIGLPIAGGAALLAPWCFGYVFGEEWREAGHYVQALAPMFWLQFASQPLGANLFVFERQDLHMLREVVRVLMMAGAVIAASRLEQDAYRAIVFLSLFGTIGYLVHIGLSWWSMLSFFRKREGEPQ